ncbi:MAG: fasciclin domain-containing protein, partial [Halobacteriota archaeon]
MVSKKLFSAVVATAVILSIVAASSIAFAQEPTNTITVTAASTSDLSTLVGLLKVANLTETLNNTTVNYTVLAPTNAAFAKLNNTTIANLKNNTPELTQVLLNHVILGKVNFTKNGTVTTLAGNSISYTVNGTKVQFTNGYNATITQANVTATNGVIDEISSVLVPPTVTTTAAATTTTSSGFLGLPGFEAIYGVVGLLVVAYLV